MRIEEIRSFKECDYDSFVNMFNSYFFCMTSKLGYNIQKLKRFVLI